MAVNQKAVKVLNKIFEAGFTEEKAIAAMTMDDILSMQGITVAEIGIINDLQKSIKATRRTRSLRFWAEVRNEQSKRDTIYRQQGQGTFLRSQRRFPTSVLWERR